jgi:hypothetical protein
MDLGTTLGGRVPGSAVEKPADNHLMKDMLFHRHSENIISQFHLRGLLSLKIVHIDDSHTYCLVKKTLA